MNIKQIIFGLSISGCALLGCNQSGQNYEESKSSNQKMPEESIKGCYLYTVNRDTFQLAVTAIEGKNFEGSLLYNFAEKDDSKGTLKGTFDGNFLKGEYTFESEGRQSVREVKFKKLKDGFIEGYGDVKEVNGRVIFIDSAKINFDKGIKFTKSATCLP